MEGNEESGHTVGGSLWMAFALGLSFVVGALVVFTGLAILGRGDLVSGGSGRVVTLLGGLAGVGSFFALLSAWYYRREYR